MPLGFKKKGAFATIGRCLSFIRQRPPPQRNEILSPALKKKHQKKLGFPRKKKVNFFRKKSLFFFSLRQLLYNSWVF